MENGMPSQIHRLQKKKNQNSICIMWKEIPVRWPYTDCCEITAGKRVLHNYAVCKVCCNRYVQLSFLQSVDDRTAKQKERVTGTASGIRL